MHPFLDIESSKSYEIGTFDEISIVPPKRGLSFPINRSPTDGQCHIKARNSRGNRAQPGRSQTRHYEVGSDHAIASKSMPKALIRVFVNTEAEAEEVQAGAQSQGVETKISSEPNGFLIGIGLAAAAALAVAFLSFGSNGNSQQGTTFRANTNSSQPRVGSVASRTKNKPQTPQRTKKVDSRSGVEELDLSLQVIRP